MKKIGILTFIRERNVGAALQAYALQTYLKRIADGCIEVEQIDFSFKPCFDHRKPAFIYKNIQKIRTLKGRICNPAFFSAFKKFIQENIALSVKKYTHHNISQATKAYDAIIVGSDQVWNCDLTDKSVDSFFLNFFDGKPKFSYAASFYSGKMFKKYESVIIPRIKSFAGISLREPIGVSEITMQTDIAPLIHIDPTLLLDSESYAQFFDNAFVPQEKYIFVYTVQCHRHLLEFSKKLQEQTGFRIVFCSAYKEDFFDSMPNTTHLKALHPKQFISLISGAEFICTTSFHGSVFSVIFKKKFFVEIECTDNFNYRVDNLLNILDLKNRSIVNLNGAYNQAINYTQVYKKLDEKRNEAEKYLNSVIQTVNNGGENESTIFR